MWPNIYTFGVITLVFSSNSLLTKSDCEACRHFLCIHDKFEVHSLGCSSEILVSKLRKNDIEIELSTTSTERKMITDYEMGESKSISTPFPPGLKLPNLRQIDNAVEIPRCCQLLGKPLYMSRCVRYDIMFSVNLLSIYSWKHNKRMWMLLKDIWRYFKVKKSDWFTNLTSEKIAIYLMSKFLVIHLFATFKQHLEALLRISLSGMDILFRASLLRRDVLVYPHVNMNLFLQLKL